MKYNMLNPHFKVSLVSYWNTKPFLFGIQHSPVKQFFDMQLDVPSAGGKKMLQSETDIALIPVVIKNEIPELQLITDYCIGAIGPVRTVCLVSNVPIEEIEEIFLDDHSLTSVQLLRVLLKEYWKLSPTMKPASSGFLDAVKNNTAALVIGDRSFHVSSRFKYVYDLAECWIQHTGLPFVFAAWFSRKPIDAEIITMLNEALKFGVDHIDEVAALLSGATISEQEMHYYLTHNINYHLDDAKRKGMDLFLQKIKTLETVQS
ncbi:MAG: menaquinone biosynthesis protein [Bacteroidetes bacterium]|nr:menaquinone biosynthesis protein [Bacteroidota bacterium]MBP7398418.1 menaquinone biosynthesis protein [Chitinophagales bacterium]MBK7109225.1 menaquinone biosynthesis protein [Bacteroidota bacterium]MBK8488453.1 menaquinone biosynthesis protein [Bacteroidota bacterium]MBK8681784.1 menaquinone biosynthesis protein [Bacteroidota bacterium]